RNRAEMLLTDAVERGVLSLAETLVRREASTLSALVAGLGTAARRGLARVAACFSPAVARRRASAAHLEREINDLLGALEAEPSTARSSRHSASCHPRDQRKNRRDVPPKARRPRDPVVEGEPVSHDRG